MFVSQHEDDDLELVLDSILGGSMTGEQVVGSTVMGASLFPTAAIPCPSLPLWTDFGELNEIEQLTVDMDQQGGLDDGSGGGELVKSVRFMWAALPARPFRVDYYHLLPPVPPTLLVLS